MTEVLFDVILSSGEKAAAELFPRNPAMFEEHQLELDTGNNHIRYDLHLHPFRQTELRSWIETAKSVFFGILPLELMVFVAWRQ